MHTLALVLLRCHILCDSTYANSYDWTSMTRLSSCNFLIVMFQWRPEAQWLRIFSLQSQTHCITLSESYQRCVQEAATLPKTSVQQNLHGAAARAALIDSPLDKVSYAPSFQNQAAVCGMNLFYLESTKELHQWQPLKAGPYMKRFNFRLCKHRSLIAVDMHEVDCVGESSICNCKIRLYCMPCISLPW